MKKATIFIVLILVIILIAVIAGSIISKPSDENKVKEPQKSYIYTDINKVVTINGKKEFDLEQKINPDCLIDLSGKNEFRILVSKIEDVESKALNVIANADKEVYTSNYNDVTNISEIIPGKIDDKESFSYSFQYMDSTINKTLIMQVHYVRVGETTYVIDIIYPAIVETEIENEANSNLVSENSIEANNNIYSEEISFLLSNMKFSERTVENQ